MVETAKRYRVAQWATGNVGLRALQRLIEHPHYDLVGLWVHSDAKVGQDAGALCGLPDTGVKATNQTADIIAAKPDCVLYMPHMLDADDLCALLASGANVVTTLTEFQNPAMVEPSLKARVEAACAAGKSSLHGTGSSPGFITEALPIVLLSLQRRLDCLSIFEFADCSSRNSPEMLFGIMGFGAQPGQGTNEAVLHHLKGSFGPTLSLVADAVGLSFDKITATSGQGVARKDVHIAAGLVPAGTVAATRTIITGERAGKPLMRFAATWYVSPDVETSDGEDWNFRESGWRVLLQGDCPLDIGITYPVAPENYAAMTPGLTAHRPVNAIPAVCAAAPGIRSTVELPQIITWLGE